MLWVIDRIDYVPNHWPVAKITWAQRNFASLLAGEAFPPPVTSDLSTPE
jgi:hypothetical protein